MPRLFIAVDLPPAVRAELVRRQPRPVLGMRLVPGDQLHLTLHFIGEAAIESLIPVLKDIQPPPFSIAMTGVGVFPPSGRANVLWAGVRHNAELSSLQSQMGQALTAAGLPIDDRPYHPHVTLARCDHRVPREAIDEFVVLNESLTFTPFAVTGFGLYSSTTVDRAPIYRREHWFDLQSV